MNPNQQPPYGTQPPVYGQPVYGAPVYGAPTTGAPPMYPSAPNQPTAQVYYPQPATGYVVATQPPPVMYVQQGPTISQNSNLVPLNVATAIRCPNIDLRIQAQSVSAGSKVVVWSDNSSNQQKWVFTQDGFIELVADRNLVLDCKSGAPGEEIIVWPKKFTPDNVNQKWLVTAGGNHRQICSALNPSLVLDVRGGNMNKGTDLILWTNNGPQPSNRHQLFNFYTYPNTSIGSTMATTSAPMTTVSYGYSGAPVVTTYVTTTSSVNTSVPSSHPINTPASIINATTNYVVEIAMNNRVPGAPITMRSNSSAHHQIWVLTADGFIENQADRNLVLDCKSAADGEDVIAWPKKPVDNNNQRWIVTPIPNQPYRFISPVCNPALALTVFGASGAAGTKLVVARNLGANNKHQQFFFKTHNF